MIEKIKRHIKNNIYNIIIILMIFVLYVGVFFLYYYFDNKEISISDESNSLSTDITNMTSEDKSYIYIDIKGYVKKPNVYKLEKGVRTIDAINAAGGLIKNANTRFINLSKELNDGDVIVIYSNDEIKKAQKTETIYVETPCVCEEIKNDACYNDTKEENNNVNNNTLININTASLEELTSLTGIGESKAKSIIEYRSKNGKFKSIDEITKVNGISETIYSKIKNNITI